MILHIDCSTGASGDKLLGALLELCEAQELVSFEDLTSVAARMLPGVVVTREQVQKGGIEATHIEVHDAEANLEHTRHHAEHDEPHSHQHATHDEHHRNWGTIKKLIEDAAANGIVSQRAAKRALGAFERVARAEAKVHGVAMDQVHFHEVGAADSIIDILFNSIMLEALSPTAVYATPVALGYGTVICEHGELPVPAPATAEILAESKLAVYASNHEGELTTPTGAALLAEFVTKCAPLPCCYPLAVGYGAGSRDLPDAANVLRIICAEPAPLAGLEALEDEGLFVEGIILLECNLDHLSAEAISFACEELLMAGALDVWQESIVMKKGRLANKLLMLIYPDLATALAKLVIELTGSLGVRSTYLERAYIPRKVVVLETPYGPVPFKQAQLGSGSETRSWARPEHDAVARLARERGLSYLDLHAELQNLADAQLRKG